MDAYHSDSDSDAIYPEIGSGPALNAAVIQRWPANWLQPALQQARRSQPAQQIQNIRIIRNVPIYIEITELQAYASTLPHLQAIYCSQENLRRQFDMYLKFQEAVPQSISHSVTLDGTRFILETYRSGDFMTRYEDAKPLLIRDETQTMLEPPYTSTFTYVENSLPPSICHYCADIVTSGDLHTPCLTCSWPICHECLTRNFQIAMKDHEAFPVCCCSKLIHPDITKGIVDDDVRARYKDRFEVMCIKRPFYCSNLTCSAFIRPRDLKVVDGKVRCTSCSTETCHKCRQPAVTGHTCSELTSEEAEMIQKFGYKRCPSCGIAQAKMHGCDHMRCRCGTHWCWSCGTLGNECYCGALQEQEAISESEDSIWDEPEDSNGELLDIPGLSISARADQVETGSSDLAIGHPQQHLDEAGPSTTAAESRSQHTAASLEEEEDVNLDGPTTAAGEAWEDALHNLSREPDSFRNEPWSCSHSFELVCSEGIPRNWAGPEDARRGDLERVLDCMLCQRGMVIAGEEVVEDHIDEVHRTYLCADCGVFCCGRCRTRILRRRARHAARRE